MLGPIQGVDPNFGATLVATGFLAVLLSGRTLLGLVLSCVLLATVQTLFSRYENAVWANAVVIGVAVVILRFRPQGLALAARVSTTAAVLAAGAVVLVGARRS